MNKGNPIPVRQVSARPLVRWMYEGPEQGGRVLALDDRRTVIHQPNCSPFHPEAIADGYLIAAAPEMLMHLARLLGMAEAQFGANHPVVTEGQAILDKATGKVVATVEAEPPCTHSRTIPGHWQESPSGSEEDDAVWIDEHEESLMVDLDLHRMHCSQCGHIGYYSDAARRYYEEGVTCNIPGLDGVSEAPLPAR